MAYVVMAYVIMTYIVMAYVVMTYIGECSFYLFPGEQLEAGIQDVYVLGQEEVHLCIRRYMCL